MGSISTKKVNHCTCGGTNELTDIPSRDYDPLRIDCNSKLRRDKAVAVVEAMVTTMKQMPDDTMFSLRFKIFELIKQKQQKLEGEKS
jgi:hypothetical protein